MSFDAKRLCKADLNKKVLLTEIRQITMDDCPLLLSILEDYKALDQRSSKYEKAFCTLVASILIQERVYFAMTRRSFQELMLNDSNYPEGVSGAFSNGDWSSILAKFYNQFKIIELVQPGDRFNASIFKVTHPEILEYLSGRIDIEAQALQTIEFNQNRTSK